METPSGAPVSDVPTASATLSPYETSGIAPAAAEVHTTTPAWRRPYAYVAVPDVCVGVPVPEEGGGRLADGGVARPTDLRSSDYRGDITLGVDGDLDGARAAARESARKDHNSFGAR